jgi:hypothetical protein
MSADGLLSCTRGRPGSRFQSGDWAGPRTPPVVATTDTTLASSVEGLAVSSTSSKSKTSTAADECPDCGSTFGDPYDGSPHRQPASVNNREFYDVCSVCHHRLD